MKIKIILMVALLMLSLGLFAEQKEEWISAKATIKKIEKKRSGRKTKELATISFKTKGGKGMVTIVELTRIPFLGSLKSVGDEISITYSKKNPALAKTFIGSLLSKYGMYILIIAGVLFSIISIMKARRKVA